VRRARLIYTVGPSGAGKDSLLARLRLHAPTSFDLHFAKRCITRAVQANGEQHEGVDTETFHRLTHANAFALQWHANGLHYGIRHEEVTPLQRGKWVIVNGSRAALDEALLKFPDLLVLHITASEATLRQRLQARGREAPDAIESRIARSATVSVLARVPTIEIRNDDTLEAAGERLVRSLSEWMHASLARTVDVSCEP
jgi:ribose 1,5-bisphosphokinase